MYFVNPSLKELDGLGMELRERVTHLSCERLKLVEPTILVTGFLLGKDAFVIRLAGSDQVKKDAGEFMRGVLDGLWGTVAGALRAVIVA